MEYKAHEVKAGLLVITGGIIFLIFLFAISGLEAWKDKSIYYARFTYVGGITEGSLVRLGGFEIGKVSKIQLPADTDSRIELVLEVNPEVKIRQNSQAFLTSIGIMGAPYVEITTGTADSPIIPAGSALNCIEFASLSQVSGKMGNVSDNLVVLVEHLTELLNRENRDHISSILNDMDTMVGQSSQNMKSILANLDLLTQSLTQTFDQLELLVASNDSIITASMRDLREILQLTRASMANMEEASKNINVLMTDNGANYAEMIKNLRILTQNMEEFSQQIKERPWNLIFKSTPKDRKAVD